MYISLRFYVKLNSFDVPHLLIDLLATAGFKVKHELLFLNQSMIYVRVSLYYEQPSRQIDLRLLINIR